MMRYHIIFSALLLQCFLSCNTKPEPERLGEIRKSDSAVIMYYHTPGDPRFFNMTKVKQLDSLSAVMEDVNSKATQGKDTCVTQGKIYFYGKGGAVYPVYFSRNKDCMQLSFIVTGVKYYSAMSDRSKEMLDDMEKRVTVLAGRKE